MRDLLERFKKEIDKKTEGKYPYTEDLAVALAQIHGYNKDIDYIDVSNIVDNALKHVDLKQYISKQ